jgi:Ser/Thr protein kinase RdoA (MazF antagonist)
MSPNELDRAAAEVLARYDPPAQRWEALGNAGGFSGARLWRVAAAGGDWCLKAWPPDSNRRERLLEIHAWMSGARTAGLDFVPSIARARDGRTMQESEGRVWDLCQWIPGRPRTPATASRDHVAAACSAVAQLHVVWSREGQHHGPCQAVSRRLERLAEWDAEIASGWKPDFEKDASDPVTPLARRAWEFLPPCLELARRLLDPLRNDSYRQHPCLGDIWHHHVLFIGTHVTGVIDYGAARIDTPAADLARLLGSLAPINNEDFIHGLSTYRSRAMLTADEVGLVHILDYTGTLLGAATWLLWLYRDNRRFENHHAVATRLAVLVERLEHAHHVTLPLLE